MENGNIPYWKSVRDRFVPGEYKSDQSMSPFFYSNHIPVQNSNHIPVQNSNHIPVQNSNHIPVQMEKMFPEVEKVNTWNYYCKYILYFLFLIDEH